MGLIPSTGQGMDADHNVKKYVLCYK